MKDTFKVSLVFISLLALPLTSFAATIAPIKATVVATTSTTGSVRATDSTQEASVDYFIKIDGVDGESEEKKKGNVEYGWKVEEGESAAPTPGVEPDEIDVRITNKRATNFSILLGGSGADDEAGAPNDDATEGAATSEGSTDTAKNAEIANTLKAGMAEAGKPVETMSLNFDKIKTTYTQQVRLFAIIPVKMRTTVEVDGKANVLVNVPWWAFLVKGGKKDTLGQEIAEALSLVIEAKKADIEIAKGK